MNHFTLNQGISKESVEQMIECFQPAIRNYDKNETLMRYSDHAKQIGLILSGSAKLSNIGPDGEGMLLETYQAGDAFGEIFSLPLDNYEYLVTSMSRTKIMLIDYQHIITPCEHVCKHHTQLINNLFHITAEKTQALSLHISILKQHSIRKKLLAYLTFISVTTEKNPFTIPMSLSALSEYLCIDRSAMMREIRLLKEEGMISSDRRIFRLLKNPSQLQ